ncbi:MAG TPA: hypothetical protein PKD53_11580, partial [Chloroflexaceae bacterium]|nr:hypothetical protein [Chloroflexaceae bacterium]
PVLALAGPVAAFNSVVLLSFGLGGYWAYRLGRAVGAGRGAALLAGFVYVAAPFHMQQVWGGTLERAATHWLALYALLLLRALARRTPGSAAAAGLALFVTTMASQYYGLYAALYTAAHALLAALTAPRGARAGTLAAGAGVGGVWLALLLPAALAAGGVGGLALEDWYVRQAYHSVALVDLIAPNVRHPLWGEAAAAWHGGLHPFGVEAGAGLGLGVALLCAAALWRRWALAWPWTALAAFCLLMAMGPQLRVTAAPSPVPGPYLLLDLLELFRNSSRPALFVAHMLVPVAALVALGLDALAAGPGDRSRSREESARPPLSRGRARGKGGEGRWRALAAALAALVLFEHLVAPWPVMPMRASPWAASLGHEGASGAVLELPPRLNDSRALLNQLCHGRPLMGGYLARLPPFPPADHPSALRGLWRAEPPAPDIVPLDAGAELANLGARYVALDLTELPRGDRAALDQWLAAPGISRAGAGETWALYEIAPGAVVAPTLGAGWHAAERDGARVWRWMGERAGLRLLSRAPAAVELTLRATAYGAARPLEIRQGDTLLARDEVPAAPEERAVSLRLLLAPGSTELTLSSSAERGPDGRSLSLSVGEVRLRALPVAPGWAAEGALPIPPTLPGVAGAPCG